MAPSSRTDTHDLLYHQDITRCLNRTQRGHGPSPAELEAATAELNAPLARLQAAYHDNTLPLLKIAEEVDDLADMDKALARLSKGARRILFFGTGGSGLGGQTLAQMSGWKIPGGANVYDRSRPRTRFYDNLDPLTQIGTLDPDDLATSRFVITSKSGGTTETLAQTLTAIDACRKQGLTEQISDMFLLITEPDHHDKENGLRALGANYGIPTLDHHTGIGGRFSCLTNVGLLPAMARGLDVKKIRAGAQQVVQEMLTADTPNACPPASGAALALWAHKSGSIKNTVMMSYADRLGMFGAWFVQLWAESLGKSGAGLVPMSAVGPRDQHSLLQLFMDGPPSFLFTVVRVDEAGSGPVISQDLADGAGAAYLGGHATGDIVAAQSHAIVDALTEAGRPVRTIDIDELDESAIGAVLMHFMLETILTGYALGVDPFDQPAVELAKTLTRQQLAGA